MQFLCYIVCWLQNSCETKSRFRRIEEQPEHHHLLSIYMIVMQCNAQTWIQRREKKIKNKIEEMKSGNGREHTRARSELGARKPIKGHLQLYNANRTSCCFMGFSLDVSLLSMSMRSSSLFHAGCFNLDRHLFTRFISERIARNHFLYFICLLVHYAASDCCFLALASTLPLVISLCESFASYMCHFIPITVTSTHAMQ